MDAAMELPSLGKVWGVKRWRQEIIAGRLAAFSGEFVGVDGKVHRFRIETTDDIIEIPVARGSPPRVAIRCEDGLQEINPAEQVTIKAGKDAKGRLVILLPIPIKKG